jgi:AraC-like DNA-binding protein
MLDAARRLRSGGGSIKEIAEACRAGDVYQFSRQFRAVLGQPPATYRDQSRLQGS